MNLIADKGEGETRLFFFLKEETKTNYIILDVVKHMFGLKKKKESFLMDV